MTRTTDTRPTAAARAAGALRNGFRERVITPPDADDDKARTLWNGPIDKRAALIARCADATDVAAALRAPVDTDEHPDRVRAAYGETTFPPLARTEARHDPDNVFRRNQNIEPAPAGGRTHGGRP